jgi:hypothetical protein
VASWNIRCISNVCYFQRKVFCNVSFFVDNFVNKTLRVKFPKEVKNILNEKRISNKKIVEMQKFIEGSKEYKNLTKVGEGECFNI